MSLSTQPIVQSSTTCTSKQSKRDLDTHELFNDNLDSLLQDEPVFFEFEDIEIEHKQKKARRSSLPSMHINCDNFFDAYTNNNMSTKSKKNSSKRSKSLSMFHPNNDDKHHFDNDDISVIDYRFEKIDEDDYDSDDDSSTGDIIVEQINDTKEDEKSVKVLLSSDDLIQPSITGQNQNNKNENVGDDSDQKQDEESEEKERVDFHQEFEDRLDKLQHLMMRSSTTQKALQRWDKKRGLPKNHSVTMVKSEDSRQKIQDEVILSQVVQEASALAASGGYDYTSTIDISAFL